MMGCYSTDRGGTVLSYFIHNRKAAVGFPHALLGFFCDVILLPHIGSLRLGANLVAFTFDD